MNDFLHEARTLFDIPDDVTYLNCAYLSPHMKAVEAEGMEGLKAQKAPWSVTPQEFFTEAEIIRKEFGKIIGSTADHIAIMPSVSYAAATAAKNFNLSGRKILVLHEEFPSNFYSWAELVENGDAAGIVSVERYENQSWTDAVLEKMDSSIGLVAIAPCHWTDGSRLDLEKIGKAVRDIGAYYFIDASQFVGAQPFYLEKIQPDFLATVAYKWLMGPYGNAFCYVGEKFLNGKPLEQGWLNRKGSEDFSQLVNYRDEYQVGARRFDVGQRAQMIHYPMIRAALTQINRWTVEGIASGIGSLMNRVYELAQLQEFIFEPESQRCTHMVGIRSRRNLPNDLLKKLAEEKIYVSQRGNALRIAPYLYNTTEQVDRLFSVLKTIV